ncbi:MAG: four helix bundle protein [Candidatus Omnitrophota bacterium]
MTEKEKAKEERMGFDFEKLEVYKKAIIFAQKIYRITRDFPQSEIYGLQGQLRRASVSISANIAEGNGRYNKKDFAQFLRIARGSIYECVPLLEISLNEKYIKKHDYDELLSDCNELAKMVNGFISFLIK